MSAFGHSRLGIASVTIAGAYSLLLILLYAVMLSHGRRGGEPGHFLVIHAAILSVLAPFAHLVGAGLGIGGLFTNRRKLFPATGTVLNLLLGLGGALILVWAAHDLGYGFR